MSREINFRAWDKSKNDWFHDCMLKETLFGCSSGYGHNGEDAWADIYPNRDHPEFILEQYTGLTDKNGKEIYEGDIVEIDKYGKFQIIWNEWACKFDFDKIGKREREEPLLSQDWEQNTEVIGNIHENPELLEDKNGRD